MTQNSPNTTYIPDDNEDLSNAVITALSRAKGRDITEDEYVLYDSIDPDALDVLFRNRRDGNTVKVEFTTHEAVVVIWGDEEITIEVQNLEDNSARG